MNIFEEGIKIQQLLKDLTSKNFDIIFQNIENNIILSKKYISFLIHEIFTYSSINFNKIDLYCKIILNIYQKFPEIKELIFEEISYNYSNQYILINLLKIYILWKLFNLNMINIKELYYFITQNYNKNISLLIFGYFFNDIKNFNNNFYE